MPRSARGAADTRGAGEYRRGVIDAAPGDGRGTGDDGGMRCMAAMRPTHLPPNVLSTPGVQLLGKGAEARPLIPHLT